MAMSYFEREPLARAHRDDLLAEAAERRRVGALRGAPLRERTTRTL